MRIFNLLLAVLVFVGQAGISSLVCACPELPKAQNSQLDIQTKTEAVCPMSGKPNCQCCKSDGIATASVKTAKTDSISKSTSACAVAQVSVPQEVKSEVQIESPDLFVALPEQSFIVSSPALQFKAVSIHLLLPRIRYPVFSSNGLRAPPQS